MSRTPDQDDNKPRGKRTVQARFTAVVPKDAQNVKLEVEATDEATKVTVDFVREVATEISEAPMNQADSVLGVGQIEPDAEPNPELSAEIKEAADQASETIREEAQQKRAKGQTPEAQQNDKIQAKQGLRLWLYRVMTDLPEKAKNYETVHKAGVKIYRVGCKIWEVISNLMP